MYSECVETVAQTAQMDCVRQFSGPYLCGYMYDDDTDARRKLPGSAATRNG